MERLLLSAGVTANAPSLLERALGAYLGLAVGDALGATVEFLTPGEIREAHGVHREIIGGGWLRLKPGRVTDDTQMAMALGSAIVKYDGWDLQGAADAYVAWMKSLPPDIGNTCRRGLRRVMLDGTLVSEPCEESAGNGAAMRNLPAVLAFLDDSAMMERASLEQSHITHNNRLSDAATLCLASMTHSLIMGAGLAACRELADGLVKLHPSFRYDPWPGRTSGYIVDTMQTVLDAFFRSADFEGCLIDVVNRGGDADTTGALAGQLAGALYGAKAIPERWLNRLDPSVKTVIIRQTERLLALSETGSEAIRPHLLKTP